MSNDYYIHEMEGADFQQQQNIEEFEQYLAEQQEWFKQQLDKFNKEFGVEDEK